MIRAKILSFQDNGYMLKQVYKKLNKRKSEITN